MSQLQGLRREPYGEPSHPDGGRGVVQDFRRITFRHPGYDDPNNILMILGCFERDSDESHDRRSGIGHDTILLFLGIIAGNRWDGFLTEDKLGQQRVDASSDRILKEHQYYFRVSDDPAEQYPIVPDFPNYVFPHNNVPKCYKECMIPKVPESHSLPRQSSLNEALLSRDLDCRVSGHIESTETAHLIPWSERQWFNENSMFQYGNFSRVEIDPIDDSSNAILLRSDIHTIFDSKRITVVPKLSPSGTPQYALHVLAAGASWQMVNLYHNVTLRPLTGVAPEFMLARLAWSLFGYSKDFLRQGIARKLLIRAGNRWVVQEISAEKCISLATRSRSSSPKKRKADSSENVDDERGRKRWRSSSGDSWSRGGSTLGSDLDQEFGLNGIGGPPQSRS